MEIERANKLWWEIVERGGLGAWMMLARFPLPPKEVAHRKEMNEIMSKLVDKGE